MTHRARDRRWNELDVDRLDRAHPRLEREIGFDPRGAPTSRGREPHPDRAERSRSRRRGAARLRSARSGRRSRPGRFPRCRRRWSRRRGSRAPSLRARRSASLRSPRTARTDRTHDGGRRCRCGGRAAGTQSPRPRRVGLRLQRREAAAVADDQQLQTRLSGLQRRKRLDQQVEPLLRLEPCRPRR